MVAYSRLAVILILFTSNVTFADVLFEGFAKVLLDKVHVGYVIQRYEFDAKKKEFTTAYFLKTGPQGGNITESLKATSSPEFRPLNYQYTSVQGEETRTIDATIRNNVLTAKVMEGKKTGVITKNLPKDAILSSFLGYVMLGGPKGLQQGVKYSYKGITEEDIDVVNGEAFVESEETVLGVNTFCVTNKFKKTKDRAESKFLSWITHKGEVIKTASPLQKISTELVASLAEASAGLPVNSGLISMVFGSIPKGRDNVIARRANDALPKDMAALEVEPKSEPTAKQKRLEKKSPIPPGNPKKEGVPGGKGIVIKAAPSPAPNEGTK